MKKEKIVLGDIKDVNLNELIALQKYYREEKNQSNKVIGSDSILDQNIALIDLAIQTKANAMIEVLGLDTDSVKNGGLILPLGTKKPSIEDTQVTMDEYFKQRPAKENKGEEEKVFDQEKREESFSNEIEEFPYSNLKLKTLKSYYKWLNKTSKNDFLYPIKGIDNKVWESASKESKMALYEDILDQVKVDGFDKEEEELQIEFISTIIETWKAANVVSEENEIAEDAKIIETGETENIAVRYAKQLLLNPPSSIEHLSSIKFKNKEDLVNNYKIQVQNDESPITTKEAEERINFLYSSINDVELKNELGDLYTVLEGLLSFKRMTKDGKEIPDSEYFKELKEHKKDEKSGTKELIHPATQKVNEKTEGDSLGKSNQLSPEIISAKKALVGALQHQGNKDLQRQLLNCIKGYAGLVKAKNYIQGRAFIKRNLQENPQFNWSEQAATALMINIETLLEAGMDVFKVQLIPLSKKDMPIENENSLEDTNTDEAVVDAQTDPKQELKSEEESVKISLPNIVFTDKEKEMVHHKSNNNFKNWVTSSLKTLKKNKENNENYLKDVQRFRLLYIHKFAPRKNGEGKVRGNSGASKMFDTVIDKVDPTYRETLKEQREANKTKKSAV